MAVVGFAVARELCVIARCALLAAILATAAAAPATPTPAFRLGGLRRVFLGLLALAICIIFGRLEALRHIDGS